MLVIPTGAPPSPPDSSLMEMILMQGQGAKLSSLGWGPGTQEIDQPW